MTNICHIVGTSADTLTLVTGEWKESQLGAEDLREGAGGGVATSPHSRGVGFKTPAKGNHYPEPHPWSCPVPSVTQLQMASIFSIALMAACIPQESPYSQTWRTY